MTEQKYYNNIKKAWRETSEPLIFNGKQWYWEHREYCNTLALKHNLTLQQVCGIFAALSPLKSVAENKRICEKFLEGKRYGHTKMQINKAKKILKTYEPDKIDAVLKGDKTVAFFRHLYTPWNDDYVVIDRHIIKICNNGKTVNITSKRYKLMANAIKRFAKELSLYSSECQAVLWYLAKKKYGYNV